MPVRGSPGQLAALDTLIATGSHKAAACRLGITEHAYRRRLRDLRMRNGGITTVQLVVRRVRKAA